MKKIMILTALLLTVSGISAQDEEKRISIKPMAGMNVSNNSGGLDDEYSARIGFTGGVETEYRATKWLGVSLGVAYSQQGAKYDHHTQMYMRQYVSDIPSDRWDVVLRNADIKGHRKTDYLSIPLLACFHIPAVKGLTLKTGIQVNILLKEKMYKDIYSVSTEYSELEPGVAYEGPEPVIHQFETFDEFSKKTDIGIPLGISYEWKNIVAEARYYIGLTKVTNSSFRQLSQEKLSSEYQNPCDERNRVFSITLGYRFNL